MSIIRAEFMSAALKRSVPITVVLPCDTTNFLSKDSGTKPAQPPYKTLYLLHGVYGSDLDWLADTNIHRLAKEYGLAIIMPAGENHCYVDDEITGIQYGQYIGEELVDVTRRMFCLSHKREDTFIGGLSMGAYGAFINCIHYHDTFSRVFCLSMAVFDETTLDATVALPPMNNPGFLKAVFGDDVTTSMKNQRVFVDTMLKQNFEWPELYLAIGEQDFLLKPNLAFHEFLQSRNVEHTFKTSEGMHNYAFWQKEIYEVMEWLPHGERIKVLDSGNVLGE